MLNYTTELRKNFAGRVGWVVMGEWGWVGLLVTVVGLTENKANSAPIELELGLSFAIVGFHPARKWKKNHPMVPPLDQFQGKNKNCSSLARTISASRRSFFANFTTFEWRFGLKNFSLL